jgi:hypothetical protein
MSVTPLWNHQRSRLAVSSPTAPCLSHRRLSQCSLTSSRIIATSSGHRGAAHVSNSRFICLALRSRCQIKSISQPIRTGEQRVVVFLGGRLVD